MSSATILLGAFSVSIVVWKTEVKKNIQESIFYLFILFFFILFFFLLFYYCLFFIIVSSGHEWKKKKKEKKTTDAMYDARVYFLSSF